MASKKTTPHPLQHMIPAEWYADDYLGRMIGEYEDFEILDKARELGYNVLIEGPTGPGKTSFVMAYAAARNLPLALIPGRDAVEPREFFGGFIQEPGEGFRVKWQDGPITSVFRHGAGVVYIDEVNMIGPRFTAPMHPMLDKRRRIDLLELGGEIVQAGPGLIIVASMNPDYEGTRRLNEAFRNRFQIKLQWDYSTTIENDLLDHGDVLLPLAEKLRKRHETRDLRTPTSTNMLIEFEVLAEHFDLAFAMTNFVNCFNKSERASVAQAVELYSDSFYSAWGIEKEAIPDNPVFKTAADV